MSKRTLQVFALSVAASRVFSTSASAQDEAAV
jgi:hypothetical protein